jgi:hypothetical protein
MNTITECIEREYSSLEEARASAPTDILEECAARRAQLVAPLAYVEREGKGIASAALRIAAPATTEPAPEPSPPDVAADIGPDEPAPAATNDSPRTIES